MRLASEVPPRGGLTRSRYTPACTVMTSPGRANSAARWMVRNGVDFVPRLTSLPVVATWYSVAREASVVQRKRQETIRMSDASLIIIGLGLVQRNVRFD